MKKTLLLRLHSPLQSWGTSSRFNVRATRKTPSKSGVIGMVAAALGRDRSENIEDLSNLDFGVRVDQEGVIERDFQIARKGTSDGIIKEAYYLADYVFVAALRGEEEFIKEIKEALETPIYPIYLGKKCSQPTDPFILGIVDEDVEEALRNIEWQCFAWYKKDSFAKKSQVSLRIYRDGKAGEFGDFVSDIPVSFDSKHKIYQMRTVVAVYPKIFTKETARQEESHKAEDSFLNGLSDKFSALFDDKTVSEENLENVFEVIDENIESNEQITKDSE